MKRANRLGIPQRPKFPLAVAGIVLLSLLLMGCGKESKKTGPNIEPELEEINGEMEALLARQTVGCAEGTSCPEGIVKIAIVDKNRLRFCTGFLVNAVTIATSSSCLTESLRLSNDDRLCQRDVHIYFARSGFRDEARVACKRLLLVSPLEGRDPSLWRADLSYIEIEERAEVTRRRALRMNRDGIKDKETLTMWRVDSETGDAGIIRRAQCQAVIGSYMNPLSTTEFDPGAIIAGCDFRTSTQGAPLLNARGAWVGIFSRPISAGLVDFVANSRWLTEPLRPMAHISNAACLLSLVDSNPILRLSCFKNLSTTDLDNALKAMLENPAPHEANREVIRQEANDTRGYFKWRVDLIPDGNNGFTSKLVPVCMNPVSTWLRRIPDASTDDSYLYSMVLPETRYTIGFDHAARIVSRPVNQGTQRVSISFSPRDVSRSGQTSVRVRVTGAYDDRYPLISENCEE